LHLDVEADVEENEWVIQPVGESTPVAAISAI
jgi:hypothetical protein